MTYAEKFKDPRWQKRRLKIMERDEFACAFCYANDKTLNVHHLIYYSNRAPWDYEDDELVTLCEDCHKWAGELLKKIRLNLCWDVYVDAYDALTELLNARCFEAGTILRILIDDPAARDRIFKTAFKKGK